MSDAGPADYPGRGDLPDALAFVSPSRARAFIALETADRPLTAQEVADRIGCAETTAYRCFDDLEEIDLVTESVRLAGDHKPTTAYTTGDVPWGRARADGGGHS